MRNPADKLKVGIVGMGTMGRLRAAIVVQHPRLQLAAVSDLQPSKLAGFSVPAYARAEDLIDSDLDAVFICAYNHVAADYTLRALETGKHVFCEKPPGVCVEDVERVIRAEESRPSLCVRYGLNHRYHYSVVEAKKIIDSGRFGRILWMRGVYGKAGGINFENIWRSDARKAGGGILLDQGIHMLDLFEFFCGGFTEVQSRITTSWWKIPVEDNAFVILRNPAGQVAFFHSSSTQWKHKFSLEVCFEDGYMNLSGILSSTRSYGEETLTFARKEFEDTAFAMGKPREETVYFDRDDSWTLEVNDFVEAIDEGRPVPSCNSRDALRLMKLIDLIYSKGLH
jgi:predicted dehydrogenase